MLLYEHVWFIGLHYFYFFILFFWICGVKYGLAYTQCALLCCVALFQYKRVDQIQEEALWSLLSMCWPFKINITLQYFCHGLFFSNFLKCLHNVPNGQPHCLRWYSSFSWWQSTDGIWGFVWCLSVWLFILCPLMREKKAELGY